MTAGAFEQYVEEPLELLNGASTYLLALVGSQASANHALEYAVEHERVEAVVMISPGLELSGIAAKPLMTAYGNRPSMILSAAGDAYGATSGRVLSDAAEGYAELREYPGAAKGVQLLQAHDTAVGQILLWLEPIMSNDHKQSE